MQTGERKWASTRRGGMTVLGKVTAPKPINLPSQRLENHGQNRDVEIVPKGTVSWGTKPSSTPNAWGTSPPSLNADGALSPHHVGGRPSSGGNSTRPSTAGSEVINDHNANAIGPNSRPSSASGSLTSNNICAVSLRPHSAETRLNSTQLSRFAEPATDTAPAWNVNAVDKGSHKKDKFTLSSGDFPSLGLDKESSGRNLETRDSVSQDLPISYSEAGIRIDPYGDSLGDNSLHANMNIGKENTAFCEDGIKPNKEKWQAELQLYPGSSNHHHYDYWRAPAATNHPAGVWFRPPGNPPFGPPVTSGGFPVEPYSYCPPQIGPLAHPRAILGASGPRELHPTMKDTFRPHMHDAFGRPVMAIRPGFYPGPSPTHPYDGYYGPPLGYANPNDREVAPMGMPVGPSAYNRFPAPFSQDKTNSRMMDSGRTHNAVPAQDGEERLRMKPGDHLDKDGRKIDVNVKSTSRSENWKMDDRTIEVLDSQKMISKDTSLMDSHVKKIPVKLMQKVEGLNAKFRVNEGCDDAKDIGRVEEQLSIQVSDAKASKDCGSTVLKSINRNPIPVKSAMAGDDSLSDTKMMDSLHPETGDSKLAVPDPSDNLVQRATVLELAKIRLRQREKEEEERARDQKAKAQAKLEELNKRTQVENVPSPADLDKHPSAVVANANSASLLIKEESVGAKVQSRTSNKMKKQNPPLDKAVAVKTEVPTVAGNATVYFGVVPVQISPSCDSSLSISSRVLDESLEPEKKSRNGKNKQRTEKSAPAPVLEEKKMSLESFGRSKTPEYELDPASLQPSNQPKSQNPKRVARNSQSNRTLEKLNPAESVVWAPVRPHGKPEGLDGDHSKVAVESHQNHQIPKTKRAEIERYVPKQVVREMNQGSHHVSATGEKPEPVTRAMDVETTHGDVKLSKQGKQYGSWRKRGSTEQRKDTQKSSHQSETVEEGCPLQDCNMPENPREQKELGRGRRQHSKGNKATGYGRNGVDFSGSTSVQHQDKRRPGDQSVAHWQPKAQLQPKKESNVKDCEMEKSHEEGRRGRKSYPNMGFSDLNNQHNSQSHYEYQPIGSQSHNKVTNIVETPKDISHNSVSRFKEKNSGYSRRGAGHLYGRRAVNVE